MTFDRIPCAPVEWILGCSQTVNSLTVPRDQGQAIGLVGVEHVVTKIIPYRFRIWQSKCFADSPPFLCCDPSEDGILTISPRHGKACMPRCCKYS